MHTIAFIYFTGKSYLGGYGRAIAKSLAAMDAATPYGQQVARLLADLKGDAREVDAHVRLEDDANCLEDTELKYVYVVRESASTGLPEMHVKCVPYAAHWLSPRDFLRVFVDQGVYEGDNGLERGCSKTCSVLPKALRRPLPLPNLEAPPAGWASLSVRELKSECAKRRIDATTCVEKADLVEKLTQAPGKPAAPSAPLVALKFLEGNWTPEATLDEGRVGCDRTNAGLLVLSAPQDAVEQVLERLNVGEGSFVRTMANSAGFGNLVAQVPRMLLELTSGPVSVISTSGSFLPPEEYAKLERVYVVRYLLLDDANNPWHAANPLLHKLSITSLSLKAVLVNPHDVPQHGMLGYAGHSYPNMGVFKQIVASLFDMAVDNLLRDGAVHPVGFAHMPTTHYPADFYTAKDEEERRARMRANAVGGAFMVGAISEAWSIDQEALETELGATAAHQVVLECVRPSQSPYRVEAVNVEAEAAALGTVTMIGYFRRGTDGSPLRPHKVKTAATGAQERGAPRTRDGATHLSRAAYLDTDSVMATEPGQAPKEEWREMPLPENMADVLQQLQAAAPFQADHLE